MRAPRSVRKQTIASQHGGEGCSGQEQTKRTVNAPSSVRTVTPPVASGFDLRQPTPSDPTSECQWQRDEEDLQQRRRIIWEIYQVLISNRRDRTKGHQDYLRKLPRMAKLLEVSLYRSAPSLEAYRDLRTLKRRLRRLAHNLKSTRTDSREEGKRMISRNPQEGEVVQECNAKVFERLSI